MLKKYLYSATYICLITLFSCAGSSTAYQMDETEKEKQRGYHANEANKIIDKNKSNRKANQRAAEKNRKKTNEAAAETAKEKKKTSTGKSTSKYSFY
jgi:predicted glycosyltransferase